jgi:hypothetical protein
VELNTSEVPKVILKVHFSTNSCKLGRSSPNSCYSGCIFGPNQREDDMWPPRWITRRTSLYFHISCFEQISPPTTVTWNNCNQVPVIIVIHENVLPHVLCVIAGEGCASFPSFSWTQCSCRAALCLRDALAFSLDLVEMLPDPCHHEWDEEAPNYSNAPPPPFLILSLTLSPPTPAVIIGSNLYDDYRRNGPCPTQRLVRAITG